MKKQIDFYGDKDNYIHLRFGDARKCYFFTKEFRNKYPKFVELYENYFSGQGDDDPDNDFYNAFDVVNYVYDNKIPVAFYYNFTDTPATSKEEIENYLNDNQ
jgi:hypothetical protein